MDTPLPPDVLLLRAHAAIHQRRALLTTSLITTLTSLRRHITTPCTPDTRYGKMVDTLRLSHLVRQMRDVTLLSVPPVSRRRRTSGRHADEEMGGQHMSQTLTAQTDGHPSPDLVSGTARGSRFSPFTNISVPAISHFREITTPSILHTSSSSSIQPTTPTQSPIPTANISTPSSASPSFQKRTFYRSSPIDEHRAPVAEWHPSQPPSRSLSVNASTNSIDTLDSLFTPFSNASSTSTETRAYGYSGWRVDDHQREHWPALRNSGAFRADRGVDWVMPCCVEGKIEEEVEEGFSVVRVRDSVFEIGVDGRIRRQTMW